MRSRDERAETRSGVAGFGTPSDERGRMETVMTVT